MGEIIIQKQQGGLGVLPENEDHITGLLIFHHNPGSLAGIHQLFSPVDAEDIGIPTDRSDETKASGGAVEITATGLDEGAHIVTMSGVELGRTTFNTGETIVEIASDLADAINAKTLETGYSAVVDGSTIDLTGPDGIGSAMNSGLAYSSTNGGTADVTQFSGGVDAVFDILNYHIIEFFRANKNAQLFLSIVEMPETLTFTEILDLQLEAEGKIKQFGVFTANFGGFTTNQCVSAQAVMNSLDEAKTPAICVIGPDTKSIALSALADLRAIEAASVSVDIGQDGANDGHALAAIKPYSIGSIGCILGTISKANVSESIGWVGKYNLAEIELDVPAFGNLLLVKNQSESLLSAIEAKGYIYIRKYVGRTGSYFNDSSTAIVSTNDYAYIERNRTINKAIRAVRTALLPEINIKLLVDAATGKMDITSVKHLESLGNAALSALERAGEISGSSTFVDPNQNVLQTNQVVIVIQNVPFAIARKFLVKIGFTTSL